MSRRWLTSAPLGIALLTLLLPTPSRSAQSNLTPEELLEKSREAYARLSAFAVTMTTVVELPGTDRGERIVRYRLGEGNQAVIEIGSLMRIVATGDKLFIEREDIADRYVEVSYGGDLGEALTSVRDRSILAGLWEPPQVALRAGAPIDELVEALRYSSLLGELQITGLENLPENVLELRLEAANGSCRARFDSSSYLLDEVEYSVRPSGAPEGYAMHLIGRFTTDTLTAPEGRFSFDPGDRTPVETLQELAVPAPGISEAPETLISPRALAERLITRDELGRVLREKRVLLVGEDHLFNEPPIYITKLLEAMGDRPTSLLMELPYDLQPEIDAYMKEGSEGVLKAIFSGRQVLQLQGLLRWAYENRGQLTDVLAVDEPLYEIMLKRSYLEDTRNTTMAHAVLQTLQARPENRIVVYAGQLHMMRAGRYRVDRPSREPVGSRLIRLGVPKSQIASVMMNGGENFHLHSVWDRPGVLPLDETEPRIPIPYLIDYPIFGATYADELFDYFVNLGELTKIELN
jgi:hypothetical protein